MSYLFLAIPNFCGSTLVHNLLATSKNVVTLTPPKFKDESEQMKDFVEGNCCAIGGYRNLNGPHSMEANMEHIYNNPDNYNWKFIKKRWNKNWAAVNDLAPVRLQKTPADIFRIPLMLPHFPNTKWIISIRNPYTYVESIFRKATFQMDPIRQLDQICHHVLRTMEIQMENSINLNDAAYVMTYEDFCANPEFHVSEWQKFIPELGEIDLSKELWVKGRHTNKIEDDSDERLENFFTAMPGIKNEINKFFAPREELMNAWGYQLLS